MIQTILEPSITTVKIFDKNFDNKIDSIAKVVFKKREKSDECVKAIVTKILTNFFKDKNCLYLFTNHIYQSFNSKTL